MVAEVMKARGYPVGDDIERRWEDISVDHPRLIEDYRTAHGISQVNERSEAGTEDLRQAMIHYRSLFDELLATSVPSRA